MISPGGLPPLPRPVRVCVCFQLLPT
uniref:Uncharacterized protein n=1 Tax=Rhizophora mucronata TaxID=61149 RepID=A0A2P2Q170_RHIMU